MNLFGITALAAGGTVSQEAIDAAGYVANGAGGAAPDAAMGVGALISSFLPLILIIVLMYFMMIRPQRKREKENKKMLDSMKVGDKIVTIGGIMGKIDRIKDNTVVIETGNVGTPGQVSYIKMERDSIKTVEKKLSN